MYLTFYNTLKFPISLTLISGNPICFKFIISATPKFYPFMIKRVKILVNKSIAHKLGSFDKSMQSDVKYS